MDVRRVGLVLWLALMNTGKLQRANAELVLLVFDAVALNRWMLVSNHFLRTVVESTALASSRTVARSKTRASGGSSSDFGSTRVLQTIE